MTEIVEVHGLRELREALTKTIPAEMQGKVLQKALSAGIQPMVATARSLVPVKSGVLRRAIHAMRSKLNSNGVYEERIMRVRHGKKQQKHNRDAFYWRFIEFGHMVGSRFVSARPFMRPAFEANKVSALTKITDSLKKSLEEAAKKASWRTP